MALGDKKLIVQRASIGKPMDAPSAIPSNAPVTLQGILYNRLESTRLDSTGMDYIKVILSSWFAPSVWR